MPLPKGYKHSMLTRRKISEAHKGKICSPEEVERLRQLAIGNQYRLGKNHSQETKDKISRSQKKRWKKIYADGFICKSHRYEHRAVAEEAVGRKLREDEVVHHINGNKLDNRNCNLLICAKPYHHWLHFEMGRKYMEEHFRR